MRVYAVPFLSFSFLSRKEENGKHQMPIYQNSAEFSGDQNKRIPFHVDHSEPWSEWGYGIQYGAGLLGKMR